MFETILLPTDGSEGAERAAEHARTLAEVADATVHVVNVVDASQFSSAAAEGDEVAGARERLEDAGRTAIEDAVSLLGDVTVESDVLYGVPHEELLDYADEHDVDVVVMGTHGRTGLDRLIVGSTTERVVRLSDRPVFTVGPDADPTDGYRNVLVPTDGSAGADPAVERALDVAEAFDATVHGLFVSDVRSFMSADGGYDMNVPEVVFDAIREQGERATGRVAELADARGVDVETAVVDGIPTRTILDYADEHDADLVVMGTHGRSGLGRLLLGSVTEGVVRRAECPVMTVRQTDEE